MPVIILYSTSIPLTMKLKNDINRVKRILDAKRAEYEEVDLAIDVDRRQQMLERSNGMKKLPQLHIDDKVYEADTIQEMEDYGELDAILQGIASPASTQASAQTQV